jgi:hypothetical protein
MPSPSRTADVIEGRVARSPDPRRRLRPASRVPWMRYPVTLVLGIQYGLFVVAPAFIEEPSSSFVIRVPLVALGISLYIEWVASRTRPSLTRARPPTASMGLGIGLVGVGALVVQTMLGAGTYAAQVGQQSTSPLASLLTPFAPWALIGAALILYNWWQGGCSRRWALAMLGTLALSELLWSVVAIGRSAPGMQFGFAVAIGAVIVGLIRLRHLALVLLIGLLAWPVLFTLRQDTRRSASSPQALQLQDARERLRLDRLLAYAEHVRVPTDDLLPPLQILRYGLIPRALDPDRPPLAVGSLFSLAVGSTPENSVSFTTLGSLYSQGGWPWVVVYSALVTIFVTALLKRAGPWAFVAATCAVWELLWIETNYPQNVTGFLQVMVSMSGAYLALRAWHVLFVRQWKPRSDPVSVV